ncbi:radical SAM protein [Brasilonema sp. UFV-L1]|uniref:7-carboxy-7-deazaguanine synthase QueE n=1 Tax=Brasilonema sp. UFV-L1 TaxID=2234130 RepID=UPI00145E82A2|nr:radical SAM protein [Brasilonema sp. UFV-L1]NMG08308.1 7-carboxy-7-deazaguanine synthase [Brasilonema sp. UFV-L1]
MQLQKIKTIPIHETFQETIQGEGYWSGTPVDFIRLAGCPIGCSWCDTGYGDGGKGLPRIERSFEDLISELKSPRVVISGGEPFIHASLPDLVKSVNSTGRQVSIETSGAFWQDIPPSAWVTLSPKEHMNPRYPVHPKILKRANEVKIVIADGKELEFYKESLLNGPSLVFLQPEWSEREKTLPIALKLLKQYPTYRLSVQLHKMIGVL